MSKVSKKLSENMQTVRGDRIPDRPTLAEKQRFFNTFRNALRPPSFGKAPTHGTFAACETVKPSEGFTLKCFHIEGAGELQLPLSIEDASKLRSVCEETPSGNGFSTMVDSGECSCWQVDASKVKFPGAPTFLSDAIQTLAMKAVCALDLDGSGLHLEASFYKLLFYEADCHFTFLTDSKNEKGKFGSLILQLPTEDGYTGGKFVVKYKEKAQEFDCHMLSATGFCYTVFFADCLQELRNIESGTRLCLAFNLVKRSPLEPIHEGSMSDRVKKVELVLEPWLKIETAKGRNVCQDIPGGKLAIPLQHKYTGVKLSFAGLKGDDISLTELLKECRDKNKNQSLDLHLCTVTKRGIQYVSDDIPPWREDEEGFEFKDWIGLDDRPVDLGNLRLDMGEEVVVPEEEVFDTEPDASFEEYDWYRAEHEPNDPREVGLLYHKAMLVVWPKACSVAIGWGGSVSRALDILQNTLKTSDPNFREQLHHIVLYCEQNADEVWEDDRNSKTDSVTPQLLRLCTEVSMSEDVSQILWLLAKALCPRVDQHDDKNNDTHHKVGVRNAEVAEAIVGAVKAFGWKLVSSPVINLANECSSSQGASFVYLTTRLIRIDNMDAAVVVANAASNALEAHIDELESHERPEFSWCQPQAKFPGYPAVERFLKGAQETYEHKGFDSRDMARSFCEQLFKNSDGNASVGYTATAKGQGRNAYCLIRKSRHNFDISLDHWKKEQKLIKRLKLEVGKLRSAVPKTKSFPLPASPIGSRQHDSKRQRLDTEVTSEAMERPENSQIEVVDLTLSE